MSDWQAVAAEVAEKLRGDAVEREERGAEPRAEIELLRESGLLRLLIPAEHGGAGGDWPLAHRVIRRIAVADGSLGHLLGYHYFQLWRTRLFDTPIADRLERDSAAGNWFWAGVSNPRDAALELRPADGGFTVHGRKFFATGASVADQLIVSGTWTGSDRKATFTLPARTEGVRFLGDWNNLGQRLSASGGVEFTDVFVPETELLGHQPGEGEPRRWRDSLAPLGFQLLLAQVQVGIAGGALAEGARYTSESSRAWPLSGVDRAADDPHVLAAYGTLASRLTAAELLVDAAAAAFDDAAREIDEHKRGELGILLSKAKVVSTEVALEIGNRVFELTGARATGAKYGMDRFWRNARTLTLHDPVAYKATEVGRNLLDGEFPPVTGYS
ncbi:acyl-CoA dehydrogenase family protein [Amycolatopsis sp. 195334CR]|uniref:acyl-CoA dehydrogenase family protein n=1 Tax=Amycolatopsis sp. 195334CR TaxID=2814588 RepID=UPI001A8DC4AF|nr:acyl-CoA dehydrogenase family protein [Amycolatopsis sp. 195334CR]MBN6036586.1 acyl-CoA dehydrogenase family protein [Amycolatopsis sp. 195334CR]